CMRLTMIAALSLLVVLPAGAVQQRYQTASLTPTCDNDGRFTRANAVVPMGPDFIEALFGGGDARRPRTIDANGNNAAGTVISRKTGARARVGVGYAAAAHGLFEGGRWCNSDYGHAQVDVTAAACGERGVRIVQRKSRSVQ